MVAALSVVAYDHDGPRIAMPRAEVQLVVRWGPTARGGLDVHVLGGSQRARRKLIRSGQRAVTVRLRLGSPEAVLGASASELAGRIVPLEDLWGARAARRLVDQLAPGRDGRDAPAIIDAAIAEQLALTAALADRARLVDAAAVRLGTASVSAVAAELGVSERNLRRIFGAAVGMGPKAFAKLERFHRALRASRVGPRPSWADIAADSGYYDQAHLIAEFREITGVTPRALLGELRDGAPLL